MGNFLAGVIVGVLTMFLVTAQVLIAVKTEAVKSGIMVFQNQPYKVHKLDGAQ